MAIRVDITQDPNTKSLADLVAEGQQEQARGISLRDAQLTERTRDTLIHAIQRHTTVGPNGQRVTDHRAVAADVAQINPQAATEYETQQRTAQTAEQTRQLGLIREALAAVDENQPDQAAAAAQYQSAVSRLQQEGVPLDPSDMVYSQGRVAYWRRMAVGAEHVFTEQSSTHRTEMTEQGLDRRHDTPSADNVLDNQTAIANHTNPSGDTLAREAGDNSRAVLRETGENYRHDNASGNTVLTEGGRANRAGNSGGVSLLHPEQNGAPSGGGNGRAIRVPITTGPQPFLPSNVVPRHSSGFGARTPPTHGASSYHQGDDWAAPAGTPIIAEQNGTVVSSGTAGGYGNQVRVRYEDGSEVAYSHNQRNLVQPGQQITRGQPMALVGQTGTATGPHVHRAVFALPSQGGGGPTQTADSRNNRRAIVTYAPRTASDAPNAPADGGSVPAQVASALMNYNGRSRLDRQGAIALRTDQRLVRLRQTNYDGEIANMSRVIQLLGNGELQTGPGSNIVNMARRGRQALENITGINTSSNLNDRQVAAYEILQRTSTLAAIEALRGVGGNDTDRDFDRALMTTVLSIRSGRFNRETAQQALGMLQLGRQKLDFLERWANAAGSPQATIDGVSSEAAWAEHARPIMRQIVQQSQGAANAHPGATPRVTAQPAPTAAPGTRLVRDARGQMWRQHQNGRLERVLGIAPVSGAVH